MRVMPLVPIESAMSKRLYDLNAKKYSHKFGLSIYGLELLYLPPDFKAITAKRAELEKFTIVQLTYHGKHYHGLASQALCDKSKMYVGLAVAYNRAFEKMCGDNK